MNGPPAGEPDMSETEFEIIHRYFVREEPARRDVIAGIGDDAAILQVPAGRELVVCMDTLVAGVHFSTATTPPAAIGHKALAVNLSDLAAMGAEPAWATLSLTVPEDDPDWLGRFAQGFFSLAGGYGVQLVGGDITRGPLAVTVQAHGFVPAGRGMRRRGARPGDHIYVTGTLGDAGLALQRPEDAAALRQRLDFPQPRIRAGQVLRDHASAAIDVSDGLLADLGHLLEADALGADLQVDRLPRSAAFRASLTDRNPLFYDLPLGAGDDYELCFTVAGARCTAVEAALAGVACGCTRIGVIEAAAGIRCHRQDGSTYHPTVNGYQHFG